MSAPVIMINVPAGTVVRENNGVGGGRTQSKVTTMTPASNKKWFCLQAYNEAADLAQIVVDLDTGRPDPHAEWFCLYANDAFQSAVRLAEKLGVRAAVSIAEARARQAIADATAFVKAAKQTQAPAGEVEAAASGTTPNDGPGSESNDAESENGAAATGKHKNDKGPVIGVETAASDTQQEEIEAAAASAVTGDQQRASPTSVEGNATSAEKRKRAESTHIAAAETPSDKKQKVADDTP